jgi:cob(I)alamin adenosyltransferase
MPRLTRIYTRTGDEGMTALVGGQRVKKNALRIETYGTADELSSAIGVARAELAEIRRSRAIDEGKAVDVATQLDAWLAWTQDVLFNLGSELATPREKFKDGMPSVHEDDAAALERAIDRAQEDLQPLPNFIHPGGSRAAAHLHVARTIARRLERILITLGEREEISAPVRRYVNRLSDALFVWARWINHALAAGEPLWVADTRPPG